MSKMKDMMTRVQDEAIAAFETWMFSGAPRPRNPYVETMWARVWDETFDQQIKDYEDYLDWLEHNYNMQRSLEAA